MTYMLLLNCALKLVEEVILKKREVLDIPFGLAAPYRNY